MNHQGDRLESNRGDGHRGEAEAGWDNQEPPCCLSAAWWRGAPLPPAPTETGREQGTPELWSGNCLDAFGHEMTARRPLGSCLVYREEALVALSFKGVSLAHPLPPVTLYLPPPCP